MNASHGRPEWQLPPGVTSGGWQYSQARFIAEDYDAYFAEHGLLTLDQQIAEQHLRGEGTVIDLGCGTGRALLPWIARGHAGIGVDLSQAMLDVMVRKASSLGLEVLAVRGNLVELDCIADRSAAYALCLFSTLGMIAGDANRRRVLSHVARILQPGGILILHVHNYWHNLTLPQGRRWLAGNLLGSLVGRSPRGDKRYDYRGIRNFFLHVFTRRELQQLLAASGFRVVQWNLVGPRGDRLLRWPRLAGRIRAQGWIVVCQLA